VALNVAMDLEPYTRIDPCGYAGLQTVDLRAWGVEASWDAVAAQLAQQLRARLAV
jgi:lipoyl(octanoyl) transferase